jgi:hypothetical protein
VLMPLLNQNPDVVKRKPAVSLPKGLVCYSTTTAATELIAEAAVVEC